MKQQKTNVYINKQAKGNNNSNTDNKQKKPKIRRRQSSLLFAGLRQLFQRVELMLSI